ncbi:helix-turn-helix domain-containing protein [Mycolicibacterium boenickei]
MARTQQQRREETVARLLDASIDTIVEVGYARASAAVIARRAKVSDGALFRHFPTMGDFMAATAHEVARRQLEVFAKRAAEIPAERPPLEAVLTILRDITGSDTNAVLHELVVAARTDEKLRAALQKTFDEYVADIYALARTVPVAEQIPEGELVAALAIMINTFDGAALFRPLLGQHTELEGQRIALLTALFAR